MSGRTSPARYAHVSVPRSMSFDPTPEVVDYLAGMIDAELNHGMPVLRRLGPVMAAAGRRGLPKRIVAAALRARPRHAKPELDDLLEAVGARWSELAERSDRLPRTAPDLRGVLVERTHVEMAFVFGDGPWPLVVAKKVAPGVPDDGLRRERDALEHVAGAEVAPRHLALLGDVWVQEALAGLPLRLVPVDRGNAGTLTRPSAFGDLDQALQRLARHTSRRAPLSQYDAQMLALARTCDLPDDVAATLATALDRVAATGVTVMQHADLLAQNWIVHEGRFSGLVDWETCLVDGLPGSDLLEGAVSAFEHGIAMRAWSDELLVDLFAQAWESSPYFAQTREALVGVVESSGLARSDAEPLLVAYFAHRLGRHLAHPGEGVVGAAALATMLVHVCRSLG
jgi:hypothetical protein